MTIPGFRLWEMAARNTRSSSVRLTTAHLPVDIFEHSFYRRLFLLISGENMEPLCKDVPDGNHAQQYPFTSDITSSLEPYFLVVEVSVDPIEEFREEASVLELLLTDGR